VVFNGRTGERQAKVSLQIANRAKSPGQRILHRLRFVDDQGGKLNRSQRLGVTHGNGVAGDEQAALAQRLQQGRAVRATVDLRRKPRRKLRALGGPVGHHRRGRDDQRRAQGGAPQK
jgi:hypothetical protein